MIVVHKNTDITEYVSSMSWGGSRSEVARKLELHIVNAPLDKNITPLTINLADPVYLFEDDGKTELFRGFPVQVSDAFDPSKPFPEYRWPQGKIHPVLSGISG